MLALETGRARLASGALDERLASQRLRAAGRADLADRYESAARGLLTAGHR